jgi:hypothetical protein
VAQVSRLRFDDRGKRPFAGCVPIARRSPCEPLDQLVTEPSTRLEGNFSGPWSYYQRATVWWEREVAVLVGVLIGLICLLALLRVVGVI